MNIEKNLKTLSQRKLITVGPNDSLFNAYNLMIQNRIRHLPVEELGEIIGILSERDLLRAAKTSIQDFGELRLMDQGFDESDVVRDYMSVPVLTIPVESTVNEVAEIFLSEKVSSLLVTEEGFPVGIVTTDDLIRVLLNQTQEQAKHLSLTDEIKVRWAQTPFATLAGGLSNSGV